jgi:hypothetical protein
VGDPRVRGDRDQRRGDRVRRYLAGFGVVEEGVGFKVRRHDREFDRPNRKRGCSVVGRMSERGHYLRWDYASIVALLSDREIDELQAAIDAGREARAVGPEESAAPPPPSEPRPAPVPSPAKGLKGNFRAVDAALAVSLESRARIFRSPSMLGKGRFDR